jgi:hypothetical protein
VDDCSYSRVHVNLHVVSHRNHFLPPPAPLPPLPESSGTGVSVGTNGARVSGRQSLRRLEKMGMGMAGAKEPASTRFATKMRPEHMQCKTESKSLPGERARKSSSRIASLSTRTAITLTRSRSGCSLCAVALNSLESEEWYKHHIAG